jgi:hypothetical protein
MYVVEQLSPTKESPQRSASSPLSKQNKLSNECVRVEPNEVPLPTSPIKIPDPVPAPKLSLDLVTSDLELDFSAHLADDDLIKRIEDDPEVKALQDPANFTTGLPVERILPWHEDPVPRLPMFTDVRLLVKRDSTLKAGDDVFVLEDTEENLSTLPLETRSLVRVEHDSPFLLDFQEENKENLPALALETKIPIDVKWDSPLETNLDLVLLGFPDKTKQSSPTSPQKTHIPLQTKNDSPMDADRDVFRRELEREIMARLDQKPYTKSDSKADLRLLEGLPSQLVLDTLLQDDLEEERTPQLLYELLSQGVSTSLLPDKRHVLSPPAQPASPTDNVAGLATEAEPMGTLSRLQMTECTTLHSVCHPPSPTQPAQPASPADSMDALADEVEPTYTLLEYLDLKECPAGLTALTPPSPSHSLISDLDISKSQVEGPVRVSRPVSPIEDSLPCHGPPSPTRRVQLPLRPKQALFRTGSVQERYFPQIASVQRRDTVMDLQPGHKMHGPRPFPPQQSQHESLPSLSPDDSLCSVSSSRAPSMGDKLVFEMQRMEREMRYNALYAASELQLANFENAGPWSGAQEEEERGENVTIAGEEGASIAIPISEDAIRMVGGVDGGWQR